MKDITMDFRSDNTTTVASEIMEALNAVNTGYQSSYGNDDYTAEVAKIVAELFEHDVTIYFVATGTAANALALSAMTHNGGIIYCHESSHIQNDESGAPSFFTGGTLHPLQGDHAKIDATTLKQHIAHVNELRPHAGKPVGMSVSQATEDGTVYTLEELGNLGALTKAHDLFLHMDGARFTNALVSLKCTPAQMTWQQGVDVLSFGATKNGAMFAEMIVFFNKELAKDFDFVIKRAGQLMSKERFIAAQFLAYFENDLWLRNAQHANAMAQELLACFKQAHISVLHPVQANEIFVELTQERADKLLEQGAQFYHWHDNVYRFVTSFVTQADDIKKFNALLKKDIQ